MFGEATFREIPHTTPALYYEHCTNENIFMHKDAWSYFLIQTVSIDKNNVNRNRNNAHT